MRIAYFVHGRGRGHASRSRAVLERLRLEGHTVRSFGGGDAEDVLRHTPGFSRCQVVGPGRALVRRAMARISHDRALLKSFDADCVISDGDMPSVLAASSLGVRSIAIGHDLVFTRCRLPCSLPLSALLAEHASSFHTSFVRSGVAVNFVPLEGRNERFHVARPDVREGWDDAPRRQGYVVAYFRDANGAHVLRELVAAGVHVKLFGARFTPPAGVEVHGFDTEAFARAMASADAVVGSAGSNLVAESIALGVPMFALHQAKDAEQRLNGGMLAHANAGMTCSFEALDRHVVARFLRRVRIRDFDRVDLRKMPTASDAMVRVLAGLA